MPEGPEVEAARALVERNVLNLKIVSVTAADDDKVFPGRTPQEIQTLLQGRRIVAAKRKAKYLWFELDGQGPVPLLHFGMTGSVVVENVKAAQYKRVTVDVSEWPPRFWKLALEFENGAKLAFSDARRFGRVLFLDNPLTQEPVCKLGFDVITELPDADAFTQLFAKYQQRPSSTLRIKALLLDQSFTAGVGNWVADEVLYQARVHPEQIVYDMSESQVRAIHAALKSIIELAVSVDADSDQFPRDWLFHYRWTNKRASSINGQTVEFVTVGSRTSAFVPAVQKLVQGSNDSDKKAPKVSSPKKASAKGKKRVTTTAEADAVDDSTHVDAQSDPQDTTETTADNHRAAAHEPPAAAGAKRGRAKGQGASTRTHKRRAPTTPITQDTQAGVTVPTNGTATVTVTAATVAVEAAVVPLGEAATAPGVIVGKSTGGRTRAARASKGGKGSVGVNTAPHANCVDTHAETTEAVLPSVAEPARKKRAAKAAAASADTADNKGVSALETAGASKRRAGSSRASKRG